MKTVKVHAATAAGAAIRAYTSSCLYYTLATIANYCQKMSDVLFPELPMTETKPYFPRTATVAVKDSPVNGSDSEPT
jgi:hypothetical protein